MKEKSKSHKNEGYEAKRISISKNRGELSNFYSSLLKFESERRAALKNKSNKAV